MGRKEPLDFTRNKVGTGLRWEVPFHLLDGLFFAVSGVLTVPFAESRAAALLLAELTKVVETGFTQKWLQRTPHLVLLSLPFYHSQIKPLMARWAMLYLYSKRLPSGTSVTDEYLYQYLLHGSRASAAVVEAVNLELTGEYIQLVNLTHTWILSFLPFVLQKINRVSFGLLSPDDIARIERSAQEYAILFGLDNDKDIRIPESRRYLAVPFVGKDVPSPSSEFSHPDVKIGLTILAYRYEKLRPADFRQLLIHLQEEMEEESQLPFNQRRACKRFAEWVTRAGAKVRGWNRDQEEKKILRQAKHRAEAGHTMQIHHTYT